MLRPLVALALTAALAASLPAQSAPKRPMTFADLQAMKRVSDPQISPSGKWVMFSVTDVSLEKNTKTNHLWVVPLDGSAKEKQITVNAGETNGRFSPDGKLVMYTAASEMKDTAGTSQLWTAEWNEAQGTLGKKRQVTNLETEADGGAWAPDSAHFLFVSSVYPECESSAAGPKRFQEEMRCNADKDAAAARNPVKAQVFEHLLYRHWNAFAGTKRSHLFLGALEGSYPQDLTPRSAVGDAETPTFSLGGPLGYAWAPDSHEIAYVTNLEVGFATAVSGLEPGESTNNDIFTLRLDEPGAKAKKVSTSPGSDDGPQYSPDGKWLAWRSQARNGYESDRFQLAGLARSDATMVDLTPDFDGWVDEFSWTSNRTLAVVSARDGEEDVYSIDIADKASTLLAKGAEFSSVSVVPASSNEIIAARMTAEQPTDVVRIKSTAKVIQLSSNKQHAHYEWPSEVTPLTHLNHSVLAYLAVPKQESFWFPAANGDRVQGFLIRPPNFDPAKKYPLKFLIHGGPQGAWGDAWSYRWNPELFAANGYVVVMVNPHGSTGYGQAFIEKVSGDWGGLPYDDLMRGLDYAEAHYPFIDKTRECALGASYGGYMANWVLTHTNRFACIVTHDGMYNPQSAFGTTEELWFNEWEFRDRAKGSASTHGTAGALSEQRAYPWDFYDKPNSEDPFRKFSPMLAIKNAKTPTLVIHGQRDYRLDVSEGFQLFTALQLLHVPSKMLYFPDEGHWVMKPQNSELWYKTVNDWCDQWTHTNKYAGASE